MISETSRRLKRSNLSTDQSSAEPRCVDMAEFKTWKNRVTVLEISNGLSNQEIKVQQLESTDNEKFNERTVQVEAMFNERIALLESKMGAQTSRLEENDESNVEMASLQRSPNTGSVLGWSSIVTQLPGGGE
ncbi:hypothetical protein BpHYR1_046713 [Brachionus plicatilis]|uniref:Uncharacterized protein n=1 Tax=Brachionus plicatilis TaxID=10195 RepID=A0A3M7R9V8_BRAPC|nr:hypothetical protein BpHYR1_046713 [Brachionus plicatilis]